MKAPMKTITNLMFLLQNEYSTSMSYKLKNIGKGTTRMYINELNFKKYLLIIWAFSLKSNLT